MKSWSRGSLAATIGVTAVAVIGLSVYFAMVGFDKSAGLSGAIVAIGTIIIAGMTWLVVIKRENAKKSSSRRAARDPLKQSIKSGKKSTNIQAGGDVNIGDKNRLGDH